MKDSDLKLFNKIIIAIILLLLLLLVVVLFRNKLGITIFDEAEVKTESSGSTTSPGYSPKTEPDMPPLSPAQKTILYKKSIGFNPGRYDYIMKQKLLVREFKNKIKLEITLPTNMQFSELDMEENIAGIYGSNHQQDKQLAIMATRGKVSVSEVVNYLRETQDGLPLLKGRKILSEKVETIDAPESSGLSELKIIPTSDVDGKSTFAALAARKDGKGSYLFIMEAPADYFQNQEGSLEKMLESVKTQP